MVFQELGSGFTPHDVVSEILVGRRYEIQGAKILSGVFVVTLQRIFVSFETQGAAFHYKKEKYPHL